MAMIWRVLEAVRNEHAFGCTIANNERSKGLEQGRHLYPANLDQINRR